MPAIDKDDNEPPPEPLNADTSEFFFPGSQASVLLIHGLTGTPYEMRHLGERLSAAGLRCLGVRLAGHGQSPQVLGATNHHNWYQSVVQGCERLRGFGDPIVVVGQSAGAVLAARLAIEQRAAVSAVALLAPAFLLPRWQRLALYFIGQAGPWASRIYLHSAGADIHDGAARQIHPSMELMPLGAALSLSQLAAQVRPRLSRLVQPVLLIHSRNDHVCPFAQNVDLVMGSVGTRNKRLVVLGESYHVVSVDTERERVALELIDFVRRIAAQTHLSLAAVGS
ncbi:MAG TPA: alpha/beta fold hydrolase [Candidatus Binataceae bacterium]|nr:alpha/beta fold hydrolase [Candidatus Binataceae bacterium]